MDLPSDGSTRSLYREGASRSNPGAGGRGRGRVARVVAAVLLALALAVPGAAADGFAFAGLSRATTLDELKARHPASSMVGHYMYVAPADTHDHVYGIEIPDGDPGARLRITFEQPEDRQAGRGPRYPTCQEIRAKLQAQYGAPATVDEFAEERARNRWLVWRRPGETLQLRCFRLRQKTFQAEAIVITPSAP